jgi:putative tryptophan/tyrosine transport system substrate-binding protein
MNRRELLALIGGAAALAPFGATAQPGLPVIGYLSRGSAEAETPLRTAFLPSLAAELIGLPAAVLFAYGLPSVVVAKKATASIPIVFFVGWDPVQLGLVASFNRPAGNATGVHAFQAETISKRLELLREVLPQPGLIAYLDGSGAPGTSVELRQVETAAQAVGQAILVLPGRNEDEIEKAFATMAERQVRGLLFGASQYFQVIADKLIALAARYRIPASYEWREFVVAGGLMSYSASRREAMRLAGDYAGRILKGAAPADLPVMQSTRFELVINLETAKALGLTIPHTVLLRADEVIE